MIFDVSDKAFKKIFDDDLLFLPKRWDGSDFAKELDSLYKHYISQIMSANSSEPGNVKQIVTLDDIRKVTKLLIQTVKEYLNGFPAKAYATFSEIMKYLIKVPLSIYDQSRDTFYKPGKRNNNPLTLYRAAKVTDNKPYPATRLFHTPYNLRSKVSTNRYSIAGFPSLYLGSSLSLCCDEIKAVPQRDLILVSAFHTDIADLYYNEIQVIDLAIKPQDFFEQGDEDKGRNIPAYMLSADDIKLAYLLWYPLIAACSYIRVNKEDPFAAEYIIPQLLMQWVHENTGECEDAKLTGIRYFSCASVRASDRGFNYVFPTSGESDANEPQFCKYLVKAFTLTEPVYLHEYDNVSDCEIDLEHREYKSIGIKKIIR